jgi:sec-independent protein translocase protein TatC
MCALTPYCEEPKKLNIVSHLDELRKRIIISLVTTVLMTVFFLCQGTRLLIIAEYPIRGLVRNLVYISPTEAFVAYFKTALLAGFLTSFPVILYQGWLFISPAVPGRLHNRVLIWFSAALVLFVTGTLFSYFVALPSALNFLISFGNQMAFPQITLGNYISFFGAFMLIGGIVFEIPAVVAILAEAGFVTSAVLRKKRDIAFIIILVISALITPTQDIFNMLVFAVPMALLYEVGILAASFIERKKVK